MLVRPEAPGALAAACLGLDAFEEMAFVLHALLPGDLFVDCGAYSGTYTVLAGAGAGAHCLAFEPIEAIARELAVNVDLNGLHDKVVLRRAAVGEVARRLRMTSQQDTANHVTRDHESAGAGTLWVPVETLDGHLEAETRPFLVKLSLEGFEVAALRGARRALSRSNALAVVAEVNDSCELYGFTVQELHDELGALGYAPMAYNPVKRTLLDLPLRRQRGGAVLFVKDRPAVAGRLASAPLRRVLGTLL
jgi:FkbM family methyltransferase